MVKLDDESQDERKIKGNSLDSLLAIYILQILKKHSSPQKMITAKRVYEYLQDEYSNKFSSTRCEEDSAQIKKVRRYLETLHEHYGNGCIVKKEGKSRKDGNDWYYNADRDPSIGAISEVYETLSAEEIEFIIDIITSSKIINSAGTTGIVKKLLHKTTLSADQRRKKLAKIDAEAWFKSINNQELIALRDKIQVCKEKSQSIRFDYERKKSIVATPYGWNSENGKYSLIAKISGTPEGEIAFFDLDKIQNFAEGDIDWSYNDNAYYDRRYLNPDELSLEKLFDNIRVINAAIKGREQIDFSYLSCVIKKEQVVYEGVSKCVYPHSLVFTDGKYYLIAFDDKEKEPESRIGFYRVDLMSKLAPAQNSKKLSDYGESTYDEIRRARAVEMHPLMQAGRVIPVTFKVVESALNRVVDAFGITPEKMEVTKETRMVASKKELTQTIDGHLTPELVEERLVKVRVRTTVKEAYRWALANAEAVEVDTQDIRNKLARTADPIYQLYTQSFADRVRKNIDYIAKEGRFKVTAEVDKDIALATFKELKVHHNIERVDKIYFATDICEPETYLGAFTETKDLRVCRSPLCSNLSWAANLTKVETVHLNETQVEDVSWMKDMHSLNWLEIYDSPVCDLSMLRDHTDIFTLRLFNTNVYDISFIENYRHLDWLTLIGCPIKDYSPLLRLPLYLRYLEIDQRAAQRIDLAKLKERHIGIEIKIY